MIDTNREYIRQIYTIGTGHCISNIVLGWGNSRGSHVTLRDFDI